ncbi:hypothetical protein BASA81_003763 [Batrachochytrium salamandrivorans]|nr:hypothetical protein BASA81_003763 [Batrachochytrium salamandrivorans]
MLLFVWIAMVLALAGLGGAEESKCPSTQQDGRLFRGTVNPNVIKAQYAVRGEVLLRAMELDKEGKMEIVYCNIGNPQTLGQKPLSFSRRVLSLVLSPELIPVTRQAFPTDVAARAEKYLSFGPVGAYSDSQGLLGIRQEVAEFLDNRDSQPQGTSNPKDIYLTSGASGGVELLSKVLFRNSNDAMIVPIPQYPIYSAITALLDGHFEGYELDEALGWGLDLNAIELAFQRCQKIGKLPRVLVVINPGNPVGSILSREQIAGVIDLCRKYRVMIFADEVYQANVYLKPFVSFRQVLLEQKYQDVQLASFHSISKGVTGECGLRGGFMDFVNFDSGAMQEIYKLASISLCPNLPGQLAVGLSVNPPKMGEASYELDFAERQGIFLSLKRRAAKVSQRLNQLEGVNCQPTQGAMYAFANLTLPIEFVQHAQQLGKHPDGLYSMNLLEQSGIVVVPGNGFGQKDGTYHFRTTILPAESVLDKVLDKFELFHKEFMAKWKRS